MGTVVVLLIGTDKFEGKKKKRSFTDMVKLVVVRGWVGNNYQWVENFFF